MANLLRENIPVLHQALQDFLADPISYQHGSNPAVGTTASLLIDAGAEAVQQGNQLRLFISLTQLGGAPPHVDDTVIKNGITYRVVKVDSDDYDGYSLSLRAK